MAFKAWLREKAYAWLTTEMATRRDMYHYEARKRLCTAQHCLHLIDRSTCLLCMGEEATVCVHVSCWPRPGSPLISRLLHVRMLIKDNTSF